MPNLNVLNQLALAERVIEANPRPAGGLELTDTGAFLLEGYESYEATYVDMDSEAKYTLKVAPNSWGFQLEAWDADESDIIPKLDGPDAAQLALRAIAAITVYHSSL